MKALKNIGITLVILIILIIVVSLFLPAKYGAENTVDVNAPAWAAFEEVNTIANWEHWEPWTLSDTTTKVTYKGPESGVGATRLWDGKKTKTGKIVIVKSEENQMVSTEVFFRKEGNPSTGNWTFEEKDGVTKVTWAFNSNIGFNPIAKIMMSLSMKAMNQSFIDGLNHIKEVAEAKEIKPAVDIQIDSVEAQKFIGVREMVGANGFEEFYTRAYGQIGAFLGENKIAPMGMPLSLHFGMNESKDTFDTEAAFMVPFETEIDLEEGLTYQTNPSGRLVYAIHKGPYHTVQSTWEAVMKYVEENGLVIHGVPYELYVNDPATVAPEEILTKICVPVE